MQNFPNCGIVGTTNRIIGGESIPKNHYPWLCSLKYQYKTDGSHGHICGLTLISVWPRKTIIVGAAHCYNRGIKVPNEQFAG